MKGRHNVTAKAVKVKVFERRGQKTEVKTRLANSRQRNTHGAQHQSKDVAESCIVEAGNDKL